MRRGSTVGGALIAVCFAIVAATFDVPVWVFLAVVAAFALWWMTPQRPYLCHMCERDIHPHDLYDRRCMYCECDATIDTPAGESL